MHHKPHGLHACMHKPVGLSSKAQKLETGMRTNIGARDESEERGGRRRLQEHGLQQRRRGRHPRQPLPRHHCDQFTTTLKSACNTDPADVLALSA